MCMPVVLIQYDFYHEGGMQSHGKDSRRFDFGDVRRARADQPRQRVHVKSSDEIDGNNARARGAISTHKYERRPAPNCFVTE